MKTSILIIASLIAGATLGILIYSKVKKESPRSIQQLSLEQILSIKELHLVKHSYNDLLFLHKRNDKSKAIRAIVQVPVTVTAYLNLKEIRLVKSHDSIKQIVLPRAQLNAPTYHVDKMVIRETRSFQVYGGKDLYPLVGNYLQQMIAERVDTIQSMAISNRIIRQAEVEGKEYIETILRAVGRHDIIVSFEEPGNTTPATPIDSLYSHPLLKDTLKSAMAEIQFGYLPY